MCSHVVMAAQCQGTTKRGARCSLTSISKIRDEQGRLVAEPLRRGGSYCRFHARPFVARAMEQRDQAESAMIVFLDFETTGLDVTKDEIVEIGALDARAGAVFSTVVCPGDVPAGPAVHGIDPAEIAEGPPFPEVWRRFVAFVDGAISMATVSDDSDSSQEDLPRIPVAPAATSGVVMVVVVAKQASFSALRLSTNEARLVYLRSSR